MSVDDVSKAFESVLGLFLEWFDVCRNPLQHLSALISLESERAKISESLRLWCVAFLVTLVLNLPLFKIVGIEWENVGFHLPSFLLLTILLMSSGVLLHFGMRIYGIQSNLGDTVGAYSIVTSCYSPIVALLNYPAMSALLTSLRAAKGQHFSFSEAVVSILKSEGAGQASILGTISSAMSFLGGVASFLLLTLIAHKLSEVYSVPKSKTLAAFGFTVGVLLPPAVLAIAAAYYFAIYSFTIPSG